MLRWLSATQAACDRVSKNEQLVSNKSKYMNFTFSSIPNYIGWVGREELNGWWKVVLGNNQRDTYDGNGGHKASQHVLDAGRTIPNILDIFRAQRPPSLRTLMGLDQFALQVESQFRFLLPRTINSRLVNPCQNLSECFRLTCSHLIYRWTTALHTLGFLILFRLTHKATHVLKWI